MPEIYRETRYTRERDDESSDDDKYKSTTVHRYKVAPSRVEREIDIEDDRRSRYSAHPGRTSGDLLEVDRRVERTYIPERPRSAIGLSDHSPRQSTTVVERKVVERDDRDAYYYRDDRDHDRGAIAKREYIERERVVDRDGDGYADSRSRTVIDRQDDRGGRREYIERDRVVDRDGDGYPDARSRTVIERQVIPADDDFRDDRDRTRTTVYEKTKEVERDAYASPRDWDRRSNAPWERDDRETDVRIERRVEERREDRYAPPGEVERYRRETEYYEPAPAPIVIRQRAPEQRIIVQDAPAPPPVIIQREAQETREVAIARRPEYRDDEREYRYRREVRDDYGDNRREEDYAVVTRRRHDDRRRYSDGESDDEYYVKRTIRREESGSPDHHHKRHLAEGALAGAGAAALLASRRGSRGELPANRGRKVIAGAALGALGTEVVRRAKSAYEDRYSDDRGRSRSRSRGGGEDRHSKLKTGLGIAAAALAVAGAAKYYQSTKQDKEELVRGRSRHRDEYSDYSRSPSRKRSRSRAASVAKAAVGTAAVAGLVQHFRSKSQARDGKSRSRSRLRTGAEIVGAGLLGAAGKKLYDRQKDKKERERERELSEEEDEYYDRDHHDDRRHRSRSRSVSSRSAAASRPTPYPEGRPADPELGMVEYGAHPLYSEPAAPYPGHAGYGVPRGAAGYESATDDDRRRNRSRRRRGGDDSDTETEREPVKKRSRSRLRDLAAGAAAAGAAAIGIKKYQDNKKDKEEKKERSRDRSRHREERDRERDRDRDRDRDQGRDREYDSEDERESVREREKEKLRHRRERDRRRYEDETDTTDSDYPYDPRRSPSPAHASGGAYYPPPTGAPPYPSSTTGAPAAGFTAHPNVATTNLAAEPQYHPYHPPEYSAGAAGVPPPVPGPPPNSAATTNGFPPAPLGPEHVSSAASRPAGHRSPEREIVAPAQRGKEDGLIPPATESTEHPKQVVFIPLSPKSSQTLKQHHQEIAARESDSDGEYLDEPTPDSERGDTQLVPSPYPPSHHHRSRRLSDPLSNRPSPPPTPSTDSEDVIELLPDRFDSSGRPIDRPPISRMYSRQGDFVYRSPRPGRDGGWNVAGQWGVAGTDDRQVEKIVQQVTSVIEGRGSVMGLLGGLLSGRLLESSEGETDREGGGSDEEIQGRRRRRERERERERGRIEEGYDYDDGRGERRRRRRRGSE